MATFITVVMSLFGLVIAGALIFLGKIGSVSERIASVEERNESQTSEITAIKEDQQMQTQRINEIDKRQSNDALRFTEMLGKLNVTLAGIDVTMKYNSEIMVEVKNALSEQQKEIAKIKIGA